MKLSLSGVAVSSIDSPPPLWQAFSSRQHRSHERLRNGNSWDMIQSDHLIVDRIRPLFLPSLTWLSLATSIRVWMYGINALPRGLSVSNLHCLEVTKHPMSLSLSNTHGSVAHPRYHIGSFAAGGRTRASLPCRLDLNAIEGSSQPRRSVR